MQSKRRSVWIATLAGVALLASCGEPGESAAGKAGNDPAAADATPRVLAVGDQAPPLSAIRWFRGDAREAVTPGRVTLVEFWATWCGPCIAAMPHLSELARTLGPEGLDVVAVSIDRGDKAEPLVEKFLNDRADIVAFEVMLDRGETSERWLKAAGRSGIPCGFVVDQRGRIAWIGHPMQPATEGEGYELDRVIRGLLDDTEAIDAQRTSAADDGPTGPRLGRYGPGSDDDGPSLAGGGG